MSRESYEKLTSVFQRLAHLSHLEDLAGWDEAVFMPEGGASSRHKALAEVGLIRNEILTDSKLGELIKQAFAESQNLSDWEKANLKQIERRYKLSNAVDPELVKERVIANMACGHAWRRLRFQNNWNDFKPLFEKVVDLTLLEANERSQSTGLSPYDSMIDTFEPGITQELINPIFSGLKEFLPNFIKKVEGTLKEKKIIFPKGKFPTPLQREMGLEVMKIVGFDFNHGRLDVSHHPFCGGVSDDVRITTRYVESDFTQCLFSVLHESGHACYEQNLPRQWLHQPVGRFLNLSLHEGQSLFFEMQIARSPEFIEFLTPLLRKHFFNCFPVEAFWESTNLVNFFTEVKPQFIRTDADEVTYPLHVILRYEIERELFNKNIRVDDIPSLWDEKMQKYLGISTKDNFKDGCMQDMHWAHGAFGYFHSYTMGALVASQLFEALKKQNPSVLEQIKSGELKAVREWLTQNVWQWGCYHNLSDLLTNATGEPLSTKSYKAHVERRYG